MKSKSYLIIKLILFINISTIQFIKSQCDTNNVCTPKKVLNYLYIESKKSIYLQNDTAILESQISEYKKMLDIKTNQILNCENKVELILSEKDFMVAENKAILSENKTLNKKVALFKTTTIISSSIAIITTIGLLIK